MFLFNNICRVCMQSKEKPFMKNLYEADNDFIELQIKLFSCVPTILNIPQNGLPTTICTNCIKNLQSSYKFRELCLTSTHSFIQIIKDNENTDKNKPPQQSKRVKNKNVSSIKEKLFINPIKLEPDVVAVDINTVYNQNQMDSVSNATVVKMEENPCTSGSMDLEYRDSENTINVNLLDSVTNSSSLRINNMEPVLPLSKQSIQEETNTGVTMRNVVTVENNIKESFHIKNVESSDTINLIKGDLLIENKIKPIQEIVKTSDQLIETKESYRHNQERTKDKTPEVIEQESLIVLTSDKLNETKESHLPVEKYPKKKTLELNEIMQQVEASLMVTSDQLYVTKESHLPVEINPKENIPELNEIIEPEEASLNETKESHLPVEEYPKEKTPELNEDSFVASDHLNETKESQLPGEEYPKEKTPELIMEVIGQDEALLIVTSDKLNEIKESHLPDQEYPKEKTLELNKVIEEDEVSLMVTSDQLNETKESQLPSQEYPKAKTPELNEVSEQVEALISASAQLYETKESHLPVAEYPTEKTPEISEVIQQEEVSFAAFDQSNEIKESHLLGQEYPKENAPELNEVMDQDEASFVAPDQLNEIKKLALPVEEYLKDKTPELNEVMDQDEASFVASDQLNETKESHLPGEEYLNEKTPELNEVMDQDEASFVASDQLNGSKESLLSGEEYPKEKTPELNEVMEQDEVSFVAYDQLNETKESHLPGEENPKEKTSELNEVMEQDEVSFVAYDQLNETKESHLPGEENPKEKTAELNEVMEQDEVSFVAYDQLNETKESHLPGEENLKEKTPELNEVIEQHESLLVVSDQIYETKKMHLPDQVCSKGKTPELNEVINQESTTVMASKQLNEMQKSHLSDHLYPKEKTPKLIEVIKEVKALLVASDQLYKTKESHLRDEEYSKQKAPQLNKVIKQDEASLIVTSDELCGTKKSYLPSQICPKGKTPELNKGIDKESPELNEGIDKESQLYDKECLKNKAPELNEIKLESSIAASDQLNEIESRQEYLKRKSLELNVVATSHELNETKEFKPFDKECPVDNPTPLASQNKENIGNEISLPNEIYEQLKTLIDTNSDQLKKKKKSQETIAFSYADYLHDENKQKEILNIVSEQLFNDTTENNSIHDDNKHNSDNFSTNLELVERNANQKSFFSKPFAAKNINKHKNTPKNQIKIKKELILLKIRHEPANDKKNRLKKLAANSQSSIDEFVNKNITEEYDHSTHNDHNYALDSSRDIGCSCKGSLNIKTCKCNYLKRMIFLPPTNEMKSDTDDFKVIKIPKDVHHEHNASCDCPIGKRLKVLEKVIDTTTVVKRSEPKLFIKKIETLQDNNSPNVKKIEQVNSIKGDLVQKDNVSKVIKKINEKSEQENNSLNITAHKETHSNIKRKLIDHEEIIPIKKVHTETKLSKYKPEVNKTIDANKMIIDENTEKNVKKENPILFTEFVSVKMNEVAIDSDFEYPYICDLCNTGFECVEALETHLTTHVSEKKTTARKRNARVSFNDSDHKCVRPLINKSTVCQYCNKIFLNHAGMCSHKAQKHCNELRNDKGKIVRGGLVDCIICQKVLSSKRNWKMHMQRMHPKECEYMIL